MFSNFTSFFTMFVFIQEEKWYSAALKEEVDKITKEKVELEQKNSSLEKVKIVSLSPFLDEKQTLHLPTLHLIMPCHVMSHHTM